MTSQSASPRRELAHRSSDGLDVTLVWARRDGKDDVVVCITDLGNGSYIEIPADPARALDVYHHPFAYLVLDTVDEGRRRAA
jgi:hypothetical protein